MELPERTTDAEDAFVRRWGASDDTDGLIAVTEAAMAARRPMLAARLVGLLEDHVEIEPGSPLDRARRAARMMLQRKPTPEDNSWSEFEDAWKAARKAKMRRVRQRMRRALAGKPAGRIGRSDRRKR